MAILELAPIFPPVHCSCRSNVRNLHCDSFALFKTRKKKKRWCSSDSRVSYEFQLNSRSRRRKFCGVVVRASSGPTRVLESNSNVMNHMAVSVELPVTCYQILGVPSQSEKDEIVKSVRHLNAAEVDEGFTTVAIESRKNLLMDVRNKLLFEPDYAGNVREKVPPKSSLRIPWAWLPGALCLLQEVGEEKLVLDIGRTALQHCEAKPYVHDLYLSMAHAECAIAKSCLERNKIYEGLNALSRAQYLLRSIASLAKLSLLSEIEESLEELVPACTLEGLSMPQTPENAKRRLGAVATLHELLKKGLDVESNCQVEDWPCYLNQALNKLLATEIVELLTWENLAATRKNKKSIESQNQRVVIDYSCFYIVMIAHIAVGFSSKQRDLVTFLPLPPSEEQPFHKVNMVTIVNYANATKLWLVEPFEHLEYNGHQVSKARTICQCLLATEGEDLKFEEAFCSFLLGQGEETVAAERLLQVQSNIKSTSQTLIYGKEIRDVSNSKKLLETWLKDYVLGRFLDTRDCSPSLESFFVGGKRVSENKHRKGFLQTSSGINLRPISPSLASDQRAFEEPIFTPRNLGAAVKQLTTANMQDPLIAGNSDTDTGNFDTETNLSNPSFQLKRNLGVHRNRVLDIWFGPTKVVGYISLTAMACILIATFKLMGVQIWSMRSASSWGKPRVDPNSLASVTDSSLSKSWGSACNKGNNIASKIKKLLSARKIHLNTNPGITDLQDSSLVASPSSFVTEAYKRPMLMEEAETLVKQWQTIKAEALGPNHQVYGLFDVLDESMLVQWQTLADAAKSRSCFWKFVLLHLSVVRADILSDGMGKEIAEIEALLEEAAELVDVSQAKNPNYYSKYTVRYILKRQENDSWRFCEGNVQTPS